MILKSKHDAMGVFTLWKARLVNDGHMTDHTRYDPFEKTAPTVSLEIVYIILNIAVSKKLNIELDLLFADFLSSLSCPSFT